MNSLHLCMVACEHRSLSRHFNTAMPVHVPLIRDIEEHKIELVRELFPKRTLITNITPPAKMLMNETRDSFIGYDCTIFNNTSPLLVYEVFGELKDSEEAIDVFPELTSVPSYDLEAMLCLMKRSMDHPFVYDVIELDD